ncbi:MAG: NHLP bacteriocin system secretion protein [Cyanobacteria bacterium P01_F01_bin.150]
MITQEKAPPKNTIFRQDALDHNASPERLDQLIQIVNPKRWISLLALGGLVTAGVAWSIIGQIPVRVEGQGILVYPSQVSPLQSATSGQVQEILVAEGDAVEPGQVIARLDQRELEQQLALAQLKLSQLQDQQQEADRLQTMRGRSEQRAIDQQRRSLQQELAAEQALTPILQTKAQASILQEQSALESRLETLTGLMGTHRDRWQLRQQANTEAEAIVISQDELLQAEQEYRDVEQQIRQVETQLSQLAVDDVNAQRDYAQNLNRIAQIQGELQELDSRIASQTEQDALATANRTQEIQETERTIAQLTLELSRNQDIVSTSDGQVLELSVQLGQQIEPGMAIGTIGVYDQDHPPMSVAFLPASDGRKIFEDMDVQVTPTTVKREEYGGIIGRVTEVSAFAVSQQEAIDLVGHPNVLPGILGEGSQVAIQAQLTTVPATSLDTSTSTSDCAYRYNWSSSNGPDHQCFSPGTTTEVQITVDKRQPITYVLPFLKTLLGVS